MIIKSEDINKPRCLCDDCFNKDICKYADKATDLSQKALLVYEEEGLGGLPVGFSLSVTCSKFTKSAQKREIW